MGRPGDDELPDVDGIACVERVAGAAGVQADMPAGCAAASLPGPRDLHIGSRTSAGDWTLRRHRRNHHGAVPGTRGARAVFLEWLRERPARARGLLRPA